MVPGADHQDNSQLQHVQQAPLVATEVTDFTEVVTDGSARPLRGLRRPTERDVLSQLRTWLLEDYIAPYCRALASTRIFRHCYWIDALDGVARAQITATSIENGETSANGRGRKKGSPQGLYEYPPILQPTVKLSQELALESKPITLHNLFLSSGSSNARRRGEGRTVKDAYNGAPSATGSSVKSPFILPRESEILPHTWLEVAPQLLPAIEQSPAIFLLNPLAPILFAESNLVPLYRRGTPTELCLLLPHKQILSHLQDTRKDGQAAQGIAAALTTLLRSDRWKTLIVEKSEAGRENRAQHERALKGFIELLSTSLKRHFTFPIQTITFPIVVGPATVEDAPYTLLFATKRQDSLFSMNDAICYYQRRLLEESYRGVLGEEWFRAQQESRYKEARQQLAQRILQQGQSQRTRRWPDLRQQLLLTLFGRFPMHDYDTIIQQLLANGSVNCMWRKASPIEERERIPGNEDTLTWHL